MLSRDMCSSKPCRAIGVLELQIIVDSQDSSPHGTLEVRVFRTADADSSGSHILPQEEFVGMIETFFWGFPETRCLFQIVFVKGFERFERRSMGRKVIRFVDRFTCTAASAEY
ncbi:uncharacterized protein BJX67DRAFT_366846 [Aspergillus lucknowensis]|uniref:Uncharacterized protein n=1 Tax=Aspergillus lucknowensis TaxID=176173 RepID=A0ABR4LCP2_9EURO